MPKRSVNTNKRRRDSNEENHQTTKESKYLDKSEVKTANSMTECEIPETPAADLEGDLIIPEEKKIDEGIEQQVESQNGTRPIVTVILNPQLVSEGGKTCSDADPSDARSFSKEVDSASMNNACSPLKEPGRPIDGSVRSTIEDTSSTKPSHPTCTRFDPEGINGRVQDIVSSWEGVAPMQPDVFLYKLLNSRGYDSSVIPAREYRTPPTEKQIKDYDVILVDAVRRSDLRTLKKLRDEGRCMNACNKHSESVLHMAARRSDYETVKFILDNGGDLTIVDDYGRTPMHDACWRNGVSFDVITLLLNRDLDLLRTADVRGACPLSYVREEFWMHWCAYFYNQKEKYWNYTTTETGSKKPAPFDPSCTETLACVDGIPSKTSSQALVSVVPAEETFGGLGVEGEYSGPRTRRRKAAVVAS